MKFSTRNLSILAAFIAVLIVASCNKYEKAKIQTQYLGNEIPQYSEFFTPSQNAEVHLGRVLFYDKNLSVNNSISCASCHKQTNAFADNVDFSNGFENRKTKRNSIAIQNLSNDMLGGFFFEQHLFWDGRETSLNSLISKPIANHIEMGMDDPNALLSKLNKLDYIQNLVHLAYGNNQSITMEQLANSMAAFIAQLTTQSKFDNSRMGIVNPTGSNPTATLNALEQCGEMLFTNTYQCNNCHNPSPGPYMSSAGFQNIGLDPSNIDKGRMNVTNDSHDEGTFKVPDLHNVALTAPYMHDGRFATLDEVLDHYSHGIQENKNLSSQLRDANGQPIKMNITPEDRTALIAFLNSMTDYEMISNPKFSNPFKYK